MAQQGAHVVHLAVAYSGVTAIAVDFFHDDRCLGKAQARTAVFLGNQGGQPARFGQSVDAFFGVASLFIDFAEVFRWKLRAKRTEGTKHELQYLMRQSYAVLV